MSSSEQNDARLINFLRLRRKKRATNAENVTVTFADVAGVDSAKLELAEVVSVMKVILPFLGSTACSDGQQPL